MSEFQNLDSFSILSHGDSLERRAWHFLSKDFPNYEVFWRRYIVILTNRVDPSIPASGLEWILTRKDVPDEYEKMAMCHYSIFYHLVRAIEGMEQTPHAPIEDTFYMLDSCCDNVLLFFKSMNNIAYELGGPHDFLPTQKNWLPEVFNEITDYRDTMLHNPLIGRALGEAGELVPRREFLEAVKFSWRKAHRLAPEQIANSRELLTALRAQLLQYLQEQWDGILKVLDGLRDRPKFKEVLKVTRFLPIGAPQVEATFAQPHAASGTLVGSPTALAIAGIYSEVPGRISRFEPKNSEKNRRND